jgi:hypothetical protein
MISLLFKSSSDAHKGRWVYLAASLRPCLVGALTICGLYAFVSAGLIILQVEAFQDLYTFGSGEHTRWEGWDMERNLFMCTVFLGSIAIKAALHARRLMKNTT